MQTHRSCLSAPAPPAFVPPLPDGTSPPHNGMHNLISTESSAGQELTHSDPNRLLMPF